MSKKDKMDDGIPEGFACPTPPSMRPILRGGEGSFQVFWRTDLEVDLEQRQNYSVELLALYLRRMIL